MLEFDGITHGFGGTDVLDDVTCGVHEGEMCAVIGPNGAGKTTLIRIGAGLLEPDAGEVRLQGTSLAELPRREIARQLSLLRQATPQTFGFTAIEIVLMGFHARTGRFSLPSDGQRDRALEAMSDLEIEELADRPAPALSGGELQRVLMARTLVSDTPVWLLDEPTAHLDYRHRTHLLERAERHAEQGGAVFAALHDLSLVERFFGRVVVLGKERVAAQGAIETTLTEDLLTEIYDVPMRRGEVGGETVWVPGR